MTLRMLTLYAGILKSLTFHPLLSASINTLASTINQGMIQISIVIVATRTHKRISHQTQQKISRPYFVVRFFTVNIFYG